MQERIAERFRTVAPAVDFCSLRFVQTRSEFLAVRQNIVQPASTTEDVGAMITVIHDGGMGYAGTSDLTETGLRRAAEYALAWARRSAGRSVADFSRISFPQPAGEYTTPVRIAWNEIPLKEKIDLLRAECERLKADERIVDWEASLWYSESDTLSVTAAGGHIRQILRFLVPMLSATANAGAETQTRTFAGRGYCRQGGMEILDQTGFHHAAPRIASEALQLLTAPNCPAGRMDVVLAPDQMILQIHESIGHPLELDRILGDERNYAGTS
ncbi:MAG: TldD/PmbA family protein, partial [Candidatus Binatia bacterium]